MLSLQILFLGVLFGNLLGGLVAKYGGLSFFLLLHMLGMSVFAFSLVSTRRVKQTAPEFYS